jgi:PAS domain S-box-containing protein
MRLSAASQKFTLEVEHELFAYRQFLDTLPFFIWLTDAQGRCTFENRAALEFTGLRLNQVLGDGWITHVHPEDVKRLEQEREPHYSACDRWQSEIRQRRSDGEYRWFLATMVPMNGAAGEFLGYVGCAVDNHELSAAAGRVAELSQANQALKQTLNILATEPGMDEVLGHILTIITQALGGSASTLWLKDRERDTVFLHLFYQDGSLLSGPESGHRLAGQHIDITRQDLFALAVFRQARPVWHEVETSDALDESAREYLHAQDVHGLLGIPMVMAERTIGAIVVRFAGPRQSRPAEMELAQGLAQQATLALQLTHLAEQARQAAITDERNRMAREIHDTLAQGFTGILVQLRAARQVLNGANPEIKSHLDLAEGLARQGLSEARRSVQDLRPQMLRDGNIAQALNRLVRQLSRESFMRIQLSVTGDPPPMNSDTETHLLRITQEAVMNAVKHSGGNQISVMLSLENEIAKLMIEDNGDGFDPHISSLGRGFGIISMHERAERIGGDLTILSRPGAGTRIHLLVPLSNQKKSGGPPFPRETQSGF